MKFREAIYGMNIAQSSTFFGLCGVSILLFALLSKNGFASNSEQVFHFPARMQKEVDYGKELLINTAKYLGPKGSVGHFTNFMNCKSCHLDAGTRPFGISLKMAFRHFPDYRAKN